MGLNYHHERADSEIILWIYINRINFKFLNPRIKSPKVETMVLDELCNQAHWQTPVDNCDKGIQKQDRDCAIFQWLLFISARSTANRQKDDSMSPTGMYEIPRQIAVAQSI